MSVEQGQNVEETAVALLGRLREEMRKVIVGQAEVVDQLLITLLANHHCFMVGVPGLAKTLMISTLSRILKLSFKRIQFTPDLMPADITGTDVVEENQLTGERHFQFIHGPVFANMVLADEINRTPPKTQAALLEAMQERQVTVGNRTMPLEQPFFVLATQNPIEQEGTYPLPEAQLDRFLLNIRVNYPERDEEFEILKATTVEEIPEVTEILCGEDILELQRKVRRIPVADHVFDYALTLIRKTRPRGADAPEFVREWLDFGAGPRAGQNLILAAKARALMLGRMHAHCGDIAALAKPVLRHRLITNFNANADNVDVDLIIANILDETPFAEI